MKKIRQLFITLLTMIGIGCLTAAFVAVYIPIQQSRRSKAHLDALQYNAETTTRVETSEASENTESPFESVSADNTIILPSESKTSEEKEQPSVPNPYAEVFAANADVAGWLQIPGTVIDYPIVLTPEDENYYLYRDLEGNQDQNGCLILDTDSSLTPLSTNLIIHGHNMRSGAMFGTLTDYESQDFYENHKRIILYTEECQHNYEVIAVFRSQVYKKSDTVFKFYNFFQADTQEEFDDFYYNIMNLSIYDTGVTAEFGDHFITLSTCAYHVEQGRFVVVAKEVESGSSYLPIEK